MFDGTLRAGSSSAVVAADNDQIGVRFGNPRCYSANTRFRDQFDADSRLRVAILQVEDQLLKVFDGINAGMGRRRDQCNPGRRMAGPGDALFTLVAGKLTAFTRRS